MKRPVKAILVPTRGNEVQFLVTLSDRTDYEVSFLTNELLITPEWVAMRKKGDLTELQYRPVSEFLPGYSCKWETALFEIWKATANNIVDEKVEYIFNEVADKKYQWQAEVVEQLASRYVEDLSSEELPYPSDNDDPFELYEKPYLSKVSMLVIGGFVAVLGITLVALAFTVLATTPVGMGVAAAVGFGCLLTSVGLFAACAYKAHSDSEGPGIPLQMMN
jgi:hypothetical protein